MKEKSRDMEDPEEEKVSGRNRLWSAEAPDTQSTRKVLEPE